MKSLGLLLVAALVGCSSSSTTGTPSGSSTSSSGSTNASSSSGDTTNTSSSSGSTTNTPAPPAAPKIDEIMKMTGALHVTWTNNETACDSIEGERQAQMSDGSVMEKYKVVFTVPGEADNKHDTSATEDMKYTYRLRCKKGDTYSEYSNTMSANPVK